MKLATWLGMVFMTYNYGSTAQFATVLIIGLVGAIAEFIDHYKENKEK